MAKSLRELNEEKAIAEGKGRFQRDDTVELCPNCGQECREGALDAHIEALRCGG